MSIQRFSAKNLPFLSSAPRSIFVSHFCSSPVRLIFPRRHQEEEARNVRVSVWWDFENCHLPCGVNVFRVSQMITAAIRETGIKGPIQITAFGDIFQLSRANQEALTSTGIQLTHVPRGGKNSADRSLLVDLMYWVSQNPPPAHLFLISGDRDFASILHRLRMSNYNIMLASLDNAPSVLCSAASIMWRWNALVKGECLTGKVFNQPPDGPYGSWYGHYRAALEDPFAVEQPSPARSEELNEASSDPKIRAVPKSVMKRIKDVLSLYPDGINISDLRPKLNFIDKDYYGHKNFYRFLMSMPNILKGRTSNGTHTIHGVGVKESRSKPNLCMSDGPSKSDSKECFSKPIESEEVSVFESATQDKLMPSSLESTAEGYSRKFQDFSGEAANMNNEKPLKASAVPHSSDNTMEVVNSSVSDEKTLKETVISCSNDDSVEVADPSVVPPGSVSPGIEQDSKTEPGFLKKLWHRLFRRSEDGSAIHNHDISNELNSFGDNSMKECKSVLDKHSAQFDDPQKEGVQNKTVESSSEESNQVTPTSMNVEPDSGKSVETPGLLNRIWLWFKFGADNSNSNVVDNQSVSEPNKKQKHSGNNEIFSDESFWGDIESFFDSQQGSLVVSQSKTREEMARHIQKDGPSILKTLEESDLFKLVDILISEKKWVEENPSEASPFKLARSLGLSDTKNGLSSIFSSSSPQSNIKRRTELGKIENISHSGVSKQVNITKPSERSKKETLNDCKKLVNEIMEKHPEGYNIGCFKGFFRERYGYNLDIQKLGYSRLASFLLTIPGVKIESTYLIPSQNVSNSGDVPITVESNTIPTGKTTNSGAVVNNRESNTSHLSCSRGEISDTLQSDDSDSQWEELGPIADKRRREKAPLYEPSVSEDEFSDSEGESSTLAQPKAAMDTEDSSLLRILDSWYSSNGDINRKEKSEKVLEKSGNSLDKYGKRPRVEKGYSFVDVQESEGSDTGSNEPNKLIDGIIGRLKTAKSTRARMRS